MKYKIFFSVLSVFYASIVFAVGTMTVGDDFVADMSLDARGSGWLWDAKSSTLTLSEGYDNGAINIACEYDDNIRINYAGDFFISTGSASAIFCSGSLEISGNGTLTVESYNEAVIATLSNLSITGGTIIVVARNNGEHAISCWKDLFIGGQARVEAKVTEGTGGGIYAGASISIADNAAVNVTTAGEFHGINAVEDIAISTGETVVVAVTGNAVPLVSESGKIIVANGTVNLQKTGATDLSELTSGVLEQTGGKINDF